MSSTHPTTTRFRVALIAILLLIAAERAHAAPSPEFDWASAQDAAAEVASPGDEDFFDELLGALRSGTPLVTVRLRAELADAEGADASQAYTWRLALGYRTADFHGFRVLAELEDIRSLDDSLYNAAGLNGEPNKTVIADPESTNLNQAWAEYVELPLGGSVRAGRQRITFDDHRFIGNVGWRQNEQTYDGALLGVDATEELEFEYAYVSKVNRIFGDGSSAAFPTERRDYQSDSHLVRAAWSGFEGHTIVAFAYLLDLSQHGTTSDPDSSDSWGLRASGDLPFGGESLATSYQLSWALQQDAGDNPVNYEAEYFLAELSAKETDWGRAFAGYELLGSDRGSAQFRTPLATGHKFNGWADAFLDNGGPTGLQDLYLGVAPVLPCELSAQVIYHKFNKAEAGGDLGWELDFIVTRALAEKVTALLKYATFEGPEDPDIERFWAELTFTL